MIPVPLTRRERLRDATQTEIKDVARVHLREHGPNGISLRAVARDMGMTAPALYRYYGSLDKLVSALIEDYKVEVSDAIEAARDAVPADDPVGRLYAMSRAFRRWALDHKAEFALAFGSPPPGITIDTDASSGDGGFGGMFFMLLVELWHRTGYRLPPDEEIGDELRAQLVEFATSCGADRLDLPLGLLQVFCSCWIRLYGLVSMEVFGHLRFVTENSEPIFEAELDDIAARFDPPE